MLHSHQGGIHDYCVEVHLPSGAKKSKAKRLELERDDINLFVVSSRDNLGQAYLHHTCDQMWGPAPAKAPYFTDSRRCVEGYYDGVTALLIDTANYMSEIYRVTIWDMLEAMVTGLFPLPPAIEATASGVDMSTIGIFFPGGCFTAQGPVSLTVQPWVTPEVLAGAWREFRKQNACYSPSEKQAEAIQLVLSHTPPGDEFAWERLAKQWEEERGERMTRGQLLKQFQRARAAILPGYQEVDQKEPRAAVTPFEEVGSGGP